MAFSTPQYRGLPPFTSCNVQVYNVQDVLTLSRVFFFFFFARRGARQTCMLPPREFLVQAGGSLGLHNSYGDPILGWMIHLPPILMFTSGTGF